MEDDTDFHAINADLIKAVEIMQEIDVRNIVALLTEEQVAFFEKHLALRKCEQSDMVEIPNQFRNIRAINKQNSQKH